MTAPISMYAASVPAFMRALRNLREVLQRGEAHAIERGFEPAVLLQARLAPDMRPLLNQVQMATDTAKNGAARLAGVEAPVFVDDESDFAGLYARIDRAIAYLREFAPAQIDGSETRPVLLRTPRGEHSFEGLGYLTGFALPNLYFHVTTAYAVLRHNGVPLGKLDYLGRG
ncbi:DUF1993 domain-containing protein [Pseudoxanthomonas daejeonensis]|uniref:DUF1993 domain-containing protein n=1 Tax=Pseudoxanthomonas daejeonensis TaxID=266062 RepID=A0ABQ6Z472_9GAMM|nr:DUF1993 domain-containing protein [Pseudoxanthomonas daejeonensis]KAF1692258.1 hypothetical protein CSC65_14975 [Pseudoxanthomonas daejeonensis]